MMRTLAPLWRCRCLAVLAAIFAKLTQLAPAAGEMSWDGPATKRRGGDTHYLAFVLGEERFALGGNVLLVLCRALWAQDLGENPEGDQKASLAQALPLPVL